MWEQMGYSLGQECEDNGGGPLSATQLDHAQARWAQGAAWGLRFLLGQPGLLHYDELSS